ncbi:hypothetical protein E2C01_072833 [Portunus trituberculatus]|uniref:Uncharacterized protein n=1 Tax=Portunus trituberculatus TaxID=210409 RepID=A0A5B7I8Y2_PORTR|nr:hypothetical protein [Portunus trituberculatus]
MPPGNIGKVLREEVGVSPRVSHRSPSRQQNWWGRSRILPSNSPDFVKDIRKRSVGINGRHISFPRALCLFQNAAGRARQRRKASRHCGSPRCRRRREKAARFSCTAAVHAAFHQGTGRLVKRPNVLGIV